MVSARKTMIGLRGVIPPILGAGYIFIRQIPKPVYNSSAVNLHLPLVTYHHVHH